MYSFLVSKLPKQNSVSHSEVCHLVLLDGPKSQLSSLKPLKESISVLFSFTRRVLDDPQFQEDIHLWLQRLVSMLQECLYSVTRLAVALCRLFIYETVY